jgi:heat shock protein HslJ
MNKNLFKKPCAAASTLLIVLAIAATACGGSRANPLRDTAWELISLGGSERIPGRTITLRFAAGEISGSTGCNTYGGTYKATQEALTLSGVYATERACMEPEGVMAQERAYLDALYAAARYKVDGDRLEVYDANGAQTLVFAKAGTVSATSPEDTVTATVATATAVAAATATPAPVPPTETPIPAPPAGFVQYVDASSGVSIWLPKSWLVVEPTHDPLPGNPRTTVLQSYPADKYVGGEGLRAGDTKCDLTIHPDGVTAAGVLQQMTSAPTVTILSEQEIALNSGQTGVRMEVDSMGRSLSLVAEVDERAVALTCFGAPGPFDEIGVTLGR